MDYARVLITVIGGPEHAPQDGQWDSFRRLKNKHVSKISSLYPFTLIPYLILTLLLFWLRRWAVLAFLTRFVLHLFESECNKISNIEGKRDALQSWIFQLYILPIIGNKTCIQLDNSGFPRSNLTPLPYYSKKQILD